jgi:predicted CoA-substrate-specific enzyme activase
MAVQQAMEAAGVRREDLACITATGYGRNRYEDADYHVSELSCHALGAHHTFPGVRTIIDIGGQDAKVISLDGKGRMQNFLMNDKCAAGTGRFLDVMANILVVPVSEMADYCEKAQNPAQISSTCTVFAESEVISQLANGVDMADLIAGICGSVARRVGNLAKRLQIVPDVCMSGGVAQNAGVRNALSDSIGQPILFSPQAQLFGAIGAALYAYRKTAE